MTDVFIVGGGPAGLAAAISARLAGLEVTIAERMAPPVDKACGEGLMPDGVNALRGLGVELSPRHGAEFAGIRFIENGAAAEARFGRRNGFGIRRTVLNRLLIERASELGVAIHWGASVDEVSGEGVRVDGKLVKCGWIIGADGHNSKVRKLAGLGHSAVRHRIGLRQHFRVARWTNYVEVHWHRLGQAYVTPVTPDQVCVALLANQGALHMRDLPKLFPALAERLANAKAASSARGDVSASFGLRSVARGRVALVGDASGAVDAISGEGISLAFKQARLLVNALVRGNLGLYQAEHRRLHRRAAALAYPLVLIGKYGRLRSRALHALASDPLAFSSFLGVHVGEIALRHVEFIRILNFGWRFLTDAGVNCGWRPANA